MNRLWPAVLPELRRFPPSEQGKALRVARTTALDFVELCGMAAALVLVTAITRYAVPDGNATSRLVAMTWNFIVAVPMLTFALGPFHVRRLRRGLREQLQRRGNP